MPWSFCLTSPRSSNKMRFTKAAIAAVEFNAWITSKPSWWAQLVQPTTKGVKFWPLAMILLSSWKLVDAQKGSTMGESGSSAKNKIRVKSTVSSPARVALSCPSSPCPSHQAFHPQRCWLLSDKRRIFTSIVFFYHLSVLTRKLADSLQRMPSPHKLLWLKWLDSLIKYCSKSFLKPQWHFLMIGDDWACPQIPPHSNSGWQRLWQWQNNRNEFHMNCNLKLGPQRTTFTLPIGPPLRFRGLKLNRPPLILCVFGWEVPSISHWKKQAKPSSLAAPNRSNSQLASSAASSSLTCLCCFNNSLGMVDSTLLNKLLFH